MANRRRKNENDHDEVQEGLDYINEVLSHPRFLQGLTPSRLPSQAASEEPSPALTATFPPGLQEINVKSPLRKDTLIPDLEGSDDDEEDSGSEYHDIKSGVGGVTASNILASIAIQAALSIPSDDAQKIDARFPYREPEPLKEQLHNVRSFIKIFNTSLLLPNVSSDHTTRARSISSASRGSRSSDMAGPTAPLPASTATQAFQTFDPGHQDLVLAVDFDFYGTRMVTASSDHKLKVWDKTSSTNGSATPDHWNITDTWRAHDAEIVDVKFNGPFTTPSLASIAEDGKLHVWTEDVMAPKNSAHRFKRIHTIHSPTSIPFCSLAFRSLMNETYLATITRDAYLAIYEPVDPDDLGGDWRFMHQDYVCATPDRSIETGFAVAWHNERVPCWSAVEAGLDKGSIGLAVAVMDVVKIYRTDRDRKLHLAITLTGATDIIRDIGWANGSMRGYDLIAAASKDGLVRIYEVSTPKARSPSDAAKEQAATIPTIREPDSNGGTGEVVVGRPPQVHRDSRSALSSHIARASDSASPPKQQQPTMPPAPGIVRHEQKMVGQVGKEHGGVWRLTWSFAGDMLITTGDDGSVRAWKKTTKGEWVEASRLDVEGG